MVYSLLFLQKTTLLASSIQGRFFGAVSPLQDKKRKARCRKANLFKGMIIIIPITKKEAQTLNKEYRVPFHDYGISSTRTKHKRFFLTVTRTNVDALNKVRGIVPYRKQYKKGKKVGA